MQTEREYLNTMLSRLAAIKIDVYRVARDLNEGCHPDAAIELLEAYQALSSAYGRINRLIAGTPATQPHA